jgi:hypothetical protein
MTRLRPSNALSFSFSLFRVEEKKNRSESCRKRYSYFSFMQMTHDGGKKEKKSFYATGRLKISISTNS